MPDIHEPEIHPLDDTSPSMAMRAVGREELSGWRRIAGWFSLLGAMAFTIATLVLLILPDNEPTPLPPTPTDMMEAIPTNTQPPATNTPVEETNPLPNVAPTLSGEAMAALLQTPIAPLGSGTLGISYEPFTISSDRARSGMVQYTAVQGDTIDLIARRYGLQKESVAWCNNRRIVQVLYPGDVLNIPPVDGVCHLTIGSATIADIAAKYKLDNPYAIIDSPYNDLFGVTPETILPSGTQLFVPGGQGELITWNPGYEIEGDADNPTFVTFAPGQAGSCGRVPLAGGSFWSNPLPNGTWIRGFYAGHTGIDIAAPTGTPAFAANGGPVVYAGWNNWGYGNTVVLAHGPFMTLYGHLDSVAVRCGDNVVVGQVIGYVGSTGNSSGPHLHFEIRYNNEPQNPSGTPGIGW